MNANLQNNKVESQPKKVLIILDKEFPPDIRVEKEINVLTKNGYDIHILVLTKGNAPLIEEYNQYTIHRRYISKFIHKTSVGCLIAPFYFNFWHSYIKDITQKYQFDAIHVHDLPLAKVGHIWSKKLNIPFVLDLHENWPDLLRTAAHTNTFLGKLISWNFQWEDYEKSMVPKADAVITVVKEMSERISEFTSNPEKIFIYQNVPEILEHQMTYNYTPPTTGPIKLVYLGGLNKNRGLQTVIKAIKLLPERIDVTLTIIGMGAYLENLKQLTIDLDLSSKVSFTGHIPQKEALQKIKEYHIAMVPHLRSVQSDNSSPNKLFQYMMMGIPVISSDCKSLKRVMEESQSGFIYKDSSERDLADLLIEISKDPEVLKTFSFNGFNAVINKYNSNNESKNLLKAYNSVF